MVINDDEGFLKLTVSVNGAEHSATVDVFEANDELAAIQFGDTPEEQAEFWAKIQAWATKAGFPQLTRSSLSRLRKAVFGRTVELAKKDLPTEPSETPG